MSNLIICIYVLPALHNQRENLRNRVWKSKTIAILMLKVKNNLCPQYIIDLFEIQQSNFNLRNADFVIPRQDSDLWKTFSVIFESKTMDQSARSVRRCFRKLRNHCSFLQPLHYYLSPQVELGMHSKLCSTFFHSEAAGSLSVISPSHSFLFPSWKFRYVIWEGGRLAGRGETFLTK